VVGRVSIEEGSPEDRLLVESMLRNVSTLVVAARKETFEQHTLDAQDLLGVMTRRGVAAACVDVGKSVVVRLG